MNVVVRLFKLLYFVIRTSVFTYAMDCTIDINMTVLELPTNCTRLFGHVYIESDAVFKELKPIFSSIEEIYGCVRIMDTRLESLSFLRKVRHISCVYGEDGPCKPFLPLCTCNGPRLKGKIKLCPHPKVETANVQVKHPTFAFDVENNLRGLDRPTVALLLWGNTNLKSFGMDSLATFDVSTPPQPYDTATFAASIRVDVVAPNFCWTLEETRRVFRFPMLFATVAPMCFNPHQKEKVCYTSWTGSLDRLEYGCVILVGWYNITSTTNPKEGLKKLATVRELYGPLTIKETNLTKVAFPNLQIVASGNYFNYYGIKFESNYRLQSVSFPKLKEVPWGGPAPFDAPVMFWNNPRLNMSCSTSFPNFPTVRMENRNGNLNIDCSGASIPLQFVATGVPPAPDPFVSPKSFVGISDDVNIRNLLQKTARC